MFLNISVGFDGKTMFHLMKRDILLQLISSKILNTLFFLSHRVLSCMRWDVLKIWMPLVLDDDFLVRMSYLSSRYALAAYWHPWPLNNFLHFQYPANAITCHVDIYIMLFSFRNQGRLVFICRKGLALSEFDLTCCFLVQPAASKMIVPWPLAGRT